MVREEVIGRGGAVAGADLVLRLMSNRGLKMYLNGVSLLKKLIDRSSSWFEVSVKVVYFQFDVLLMRIY